MEAPTIIKLEQEIEREMLIDAGEDLSSDEEQFYEPEVQKQKVAADFKSLDEMVSYSYTRQKLLFNVNKGKLNILVLFINRTFPFWLINKYMYTLTHSIFNLKVIQ